MTRRSCSLCAPTREQLLEQRRADLGLSEDDHLPGLVLPVWDAGQGGASSGGGMGSGEVE